MFHEWARGTVSLGDVPDSFAAPPSLAGDFVYGVSQSLSATSLEPLASAKWSDRKPTEWVVNTALSPSHANPEAGAGAAAANSGMARCRRLRR